MMKKRRSIDKTKNIPFNLKWSAKTKQAIKVQRKGLLSKFARGKFSNRKQLKKMKRRR